MNYYLQDSNSVYWQLGITTTGDLTQTVVGPQTIVPLVLKDISNNYWQLGITINGDLTQTPTSPAATTFIQLIDSSGGIWNVSIDTNGDLHQDFAGYQIYPSGATDGPDFMWLGGDN
jgi:hypothetical protein